MVPLLFRCESCRHCKWVDQVVDDAPWVVNEAFLDTRREWKELSDTAREFVRGFSRRGRTGPEGAPSSGGSGAAQPPNELVGRVGAVVHHTLGLTGSVLKLSLSCLSYLNPLSYC